MKIYVSHSSNFDYQSELYVPLKESIGRNHELFLPHDEKLEGVNSKELISTHDVVLAEVSYPSTGQGIELGWASTNSVPIICFYQSEQNPSTALRFVTSTLEPYKTTRELVEKIEASLSLFTSNHHS